MAPTATIPTESPQKLATPVTFISRSPNQVITRKPERYVDNGMGGKTRQSEAEWIEAQVEKNHEREIAGLPPLEIDRTPWRAVFEHNVYVTDSPTMVEFLRSHSKFNINGPSAFWEEGAAPDEPKPTVTEQMEAIAVGAAEADIDAVTKALDVEKETHNRVPVIRAAEAVLRSFADEGSGSDSSETGDPPSDPSSTD